MKRSFRFETWCGSLRLVTRDDNSTTTMDVRRVQPDGREHVQIAVTVDRHHAKRTVSQHGYIELSPDDVPVLIAALTKLHPKHDPQAPHLSFHEKDKQDRAFYGLPT